MPIFQTTFDIAAPAQRVWTILTGFEAYGDWNPQIPSLQGKAEPGAEVRLRLSLPERPAMNVSATLEEVRPERLLTWRGQLLAPWFFEGYRRFEIEPLDGGAVRVTHTEDLRGLFAPLFGLLMGGPAARSHAALNAALAARAARA